VMSLPLSTTLLRPAATGDHAPRETDAGARPSISVIIAAYNARETLAER